MTKPSPEPAAEIFPVPVILADGSTIQGEFLVYDTNRLCRLDLSFDDRLISKTARDLFEALILIRHELDAVGLKVVCYGACQDVHPSGRSRSQSRGVKASRRVMGQKPTEETLNILATGPDVIPVTVREQDNYYDEWVLSVGREINPKLSIPVKYRRRKSTLRTRLVVLGLTLFVVAIAITYKKFRTYPPPIPPHSTQNRK